MAQDHHRYTQVTHYDDADKRQDCAERIGQERQRISQERGNGQPDCHAPRSPPLAGQLGSAVSSTGAHSAGLTVSHGAAKSPTTPLTIVSGTIRRADESVKLSRASTTC